MSAEMWLCAVVIGITSSFCFNRLEITRRTKIVFGRAKAKRIRSNSSTAKRRHNTNSWRQNATKITHQIHQSSQSQEEWSHMVNQYKLWFPRRILFMPCRYCWIITHNTISDLQWWSWIVWTDNKNVLWKNQYLFMICSCMWQKF